MRDGHLAILAYVIIEVKPRLHEREGHMGRRTGADDKPGTREANKKRKESLKPFIVPAAAFHEAGHAIVGIALGGTPNEVSIQRDGTGIVTWDIQPTWLPRGKWPPNLFFAQLTVSVAGPMAEALYGPELPLGPDGLDVRLISTELAQGENPEDYFGSDEDAEDSDLGGVFGLAFLILGHRDLPATQALVLRAEKLARKILVQDKGLCLKAAALLRRCPGRRMTATQIESLIQGCTFREITMK